MKWTDQTPPWLAPIPRRRGGGLIASGLLLVLGTFVFILVMAYLGATHTLYTLIPLALGLLLLMIGLARRGSD